MKKYLNLVFEDARIFREFKESKITDFYVEFGYPQDRKNQSYFVEPITVYQVANLISVLMGERPYPSLRRVFFKRYEPALEIAYNSYLKITSLKVRDKFTHNDVYAYESMQLKKSATDSFSKVNYFSWEKVKKILPEDGAFDFFVREISNYLGVEDCTKITFKQVRNKIIEDFSIYYEYDLKNCQEQSINFLIDKGPFPEGLRNLFLTLSGEIPFREQIYLRKKMFVSALILYNYTAFNKCPNVKRLIQTDFVDNVLRLSGELIIPLEDYQLEKIRNGSGCATFLDGGLVSFKRLLKGREPIFKDFKKLSEISTQTKPYTQKTT